MNIRLAIHTSERLVQADLEVPQREVEDAIRRHGWDAATNFYIQSAFRLCCNELMGTSVVTPAINDPRVAAAIKSINNP